MAQSTSQVVNQTTRLSPQQLLVSKMVQATNEELDKLIVDEAERNLALELTDSRLAERPEPEGQEGADDMDGYRDTETGGAENGEASDASDDYYADDDDTRESSQETLGDYTDSYYEFNDGEVPSAQNRSADDDGDFSPLNNYRGDKTFREDLLQQVEEMELNAEDLYLARYLVNALDDSGYLTRSLDDLADDLAFTQMHDTTPAELERVLTDVIQSLEPAGIGARNLRECLLLQLEEKKATKDVQLAYDIIDKAFDDFTARRIEKLCSRFKVTEEALSQAQRVICHLNPKPGGLDAAQDAIGTKASHVKPDFSIHNEDGQLEVSIIESGVGVRISPDYLLMQERIRSQKTKSEDSRQGLALINEGIAQANAFISALTIRRETLSRVISAIAQLQQDYFLHGGNSEDLRPMILQDVADRSGYDISTVSRVSNSKYIETDFGVIAVKDLFTTAIKTAQGDAVSNQAVMETLRELISAEDKRNPLSDDALAALLSDKGFPIARRTVAKYREQLGFPVARLRRNV